MIPTGPGRTPSPTIASAQPPARGWWRKCRRKWLAEQRPLSDGQATWRALATACLASLVFLTLPSAPPDLGVDSGWCAVLNWAHWRGWQFGKDIVFTYGPLGFLVAPYYFGQPTGLLLLANSLLCFNVALGLGLVAWRLGPAGRWLLLGMFIFEIANVESRIDLAFEIGLLTWGVLCLTESGRRRCLCAAGLIALTAFAALSKVSYLFVGSFSVCAIALCVGLRAEWRFALGMLVSFVATFVLGWLACGQTLSNLGSFLDNGYLISRGYDEAAGLEGLPMLRIGGWLLGLLAGGALLLRIPAAQDTTRRHAGWHAAVVAMWLAGLLFVVWKHSMVRVDRYHLIELALFSPIMALALEALPHARGRLHWAARSLALGACVLSLVLVQSAFFPGWSASIKEPFRQFAYHVRCLLAPGDWKHLQETALQALHQQAQLPALTSRITNSTIDVFGSAQAYAVLNDLNYRPRPVFQSYAAYDARLARLNERFYRSDRAPDFVLFALSPQEHRFPALNDGPALRTLLMNYRPVESEGPFLLLKRASQATAALTLLREGSFPANARIELGRYAGESLWIEVEIQRSLAGCLAGWLSRQPILRLAAWNGPKLLARGRAAAPLLKIGFVGSPCLLKLRDVQDFYRGEPVIRPTAYSVEFAPGTAWFWDKEARYRVYRIENLP